MVNKKPSMINFKKTFTFKVRGESLVLFQLRQQLVEGVGGGLLFQPAHQVGLKIKKMKISQWVSVFPLV